MGEGGEGHALVKVFIDLLHNIKAGDHRVMWKEMETQWSCGGGMAQRLAHQIRLELCPCQCVEWVAAWGHGWKSERVVGGNCSAKTEKRQKGANPKNPKPK